MLAINSRIFAIHIPQTKHTAAIDIKMLYRIPAAFVMMHRDKQSLWTRGFGRHANGSWYTISYNA